MNDLPDVNALGGAGPIFVVVITVAVIGAFLSKKAAEIGGPLGAAGRWWSQRQVRRVQRERELSSEKREGRDELVSRLEADIVRLTERADRQESEMQTQRVEHAAELAAFYDHIVALVSWAQRARVTAAAGGIELPPTPTFPTPRPSESDTPGGAS